MSVYVMGDFMYSIKVESYGPNGEYAIQHVTSPSGDVTMYYIRLYKRSDDGTIIFLPDGGKQVEVRYVGGRLKNKFLVSEDGIIFSVRSKKKIALTISKTGYYVFSTRMYGRKGKAYTSKVSRLVAKAFIDNPLNLPFVNHIDGVKLNNHRSNLEWCTAQENTIHAVGLGLINPRRGLEVPNAAIKDPATVRAIRSLMGKLSQRKIAKRFKVSRYVVRRIHIGESYTNVA